MNNSASLFNNHCFVRYCGGSGSDARRVITETLYFGQSSGRRCPDTTMFLFLMNSLIEVY